MSTADILSQDPVLRPMVEKFTGGSLREQMSLEEAKKMAAASIPILFSLLERPEDKQTCLQMLLSACLEKVEEIPNTSVPINGEEAKAVEAKAVEAKNEAGEKELTLFFTEALQGHEGKGFKYLLDLSGASDPAGLFEFFQNQIEFAKTDMLKSVVCNSEFEILHSSFNGRALLIKKFPVKSDTPTVFRDLVYGVWMPKSASFSLEDFKGLWIDETNSVAAHKAYHAAHQNVLPVVGFFLQGHPNPTLALIQQLPGDEVCTFGDLLRRGTPYDRKVFAKSLVAALSYVHDCGITLRGFLNPETVYCDPQGETLLLDSYLLSRHKDFHSPLYLITNTLEEGKKSDIYSLGLMIYVILTGRELPSEVSDFDDPRNPSLQLCEPFNIISRCCHPDPKKRPNADFVEDVVIDSITLGKWDTFVKSGILPFQKTSLNPKSVLKTAVLHQESLLNKLSDTDPRSINVEATLVAHNSYEILQEQEIINLHKKISALLNVPHQISSKIACKLAAFLSLGKVDTVKIKRRGSDAENLFSMAGNGWLCQNNFKERDQFVDKVSDYLPSADGDYLLFTKQGNPCGFELTCSNLVIQSIGQLYTVRMINL